VRSDLQPLFRPERIAVVGASRGGGKLGAVMARSLAGYRGGPALVNSRSADPANGIHACVADAVAASDRIDLAVMCVPASVTATSLREAAAAGVRAAVVCAGGFAEAGGTGIGFQQEVADALSDTGIRLLGPNTSGFFVPATGLTASFVPGVQGIVAGRVAVVAASGGVNHALCFLLAEAGVGVSLGVGLGNGIDISASDVLDYLRTDESTSAVAVHIESVSDGPALLAAVAALSRVKPVVALVVGRSDVGAFAQSHTGALATSWRTTRSVLRQAGAVVVDDERALLDAVTALSLQRLDPNPNPCVALVTGQAGPGLLIMDALKTRGVDLPELTDETQIRLRELLPPLTFQANPVDTGRPDQSFPQVLTTVAADPGVDLIAVYGLTEPDVIDLPSAATAAGLPQNRPTLFGLGGPPEEVRRTAAAAGAIGIPALLSPAAVAAAVLGLVQDAIGQHRLQPSPIATGRSWTEGPWDEDQAKALLDDWGIATTERCRFEDREAAQTALETLIAPVAVKILDATLLHKTEIGGVHLDIRTHDELTAALDALQEIGAKRFLVESMAPPGVDLVLGVRKDPVFGPVVLLGLGGTAAEVYGDVAIRSLPAGTLELASMVDDLQAAALVCGWRGGPTLDRDDLVAVITALTDALLSARDVAEIEINPLRLTPGGLVALDAVIISEKEVNDAPTDH
jgi:acyl-CoA synthetase (NDP forming)